MGGSKDTQSAREFLSLACESGEAEGCSMLSTLD